MKKVINITLAGMVFAVEEDAFNALSTYLEKITASLDSNCDIEEVKGDIETAIAEKLIARNKNKNMAVTITEVEAIMEELGDPSDFNEGPVSSKDNATETNNSDAKEDVSKRLYRDPDTGLVAGVCSGIAQYFNIDPVIVRLVFIFAAFLNGFGFLVYAILWLIVPAAKTTEQKFAMRGDSVTLKEITDRVKKNVKSVDTEQVKTKSDKAWFAARPILKKVVDFIGLCARYVFTFARYIVGIAFVLAATFGITLLIMASTVLWLSNRPLSLPGAESLMELVFADVSGYVLFISLLFVLLVPFLIVLLTGSSILAKRNYFTIKKSVALFAIWLVAMATAGSIGTVYITDMEIRNRLQTIVESEICMNPTCEEVRDINY